MIRALFVYRYCTLGGVETGLRFRIERLPEFMIDSQELFLRDYGGWQSFIGLEDRAFLNPSEEFFTSLIRRERYDLVSVIDSFDVLDWIAGSEWDGKVMVELRSTYEHTLAELKRLGDHRVDGILVPSCFQHDNVASHLPRRVRHEVPRFVAHNFVDLEHFSGADGYGLGASGPQIVAWIGRIDPLKNWQDFLKVADRLATRPDVEFWMVGGGGSAEEARTEFRKALTGTRVASRLRWWPLLNSGAMQRLYPTITASGGTVLLTTKNESFGFAALEAMASGCPLVAAAVGALPEIIEDGETGFLYPSGDVKAAASRVAELLDQPQLRERMGRRAAEVTRERFAPEKCLADFAEAVRKVVATAVNP